VNGRRQYSSPVRRQKAEETRLRIIEAGAELVRSSTSWTWDDVTFRTVAEHAGVGESTVYRHFSRERDLHDAILHQLQADAGVSYEGVGLEDLPRIATQVFTALSGFAVTQTGETLEPGHFPDQDEFRRQVLRTVITAAAPAWSERDQVMAAATLDVLWSVPTYERLISKWGMDTAEATATVRWAMGSVMAAIAPAPPSGRG
jgi:AcrR family transcriptional regulator